MTNKIPESPCRTPKSPDFGLSRHLWTPKSPDFSLTNPSSRSPKSPYFRLTNPSSQSSKSPGLGLTNHSSRSPKSPDFGLTRRDFLKLTGLAAASLALLETGCSPQALESGLP